MLDTEPYRISSTEFSTKDAQSARLYGRLNLLRLARLKPTDNQAAFARACRLQTHATTHIEKDHDQVYDDDRQPHQTQSCSR